MAYRPKFRKQTDGSRCQWKNCNPTCHSVASDRAQRGVRPLRAPDWLPAPTTIQKAIYGGDPCRGTYFSENKAAVQRLYHVEMEERFGLPWADHLVILDSGRGFVGHTKYSALRGTRFDSCPTFDGYHSIYFNERAYLAIGAAYSGSPAGWYHLTSDPLADGRWLSSVGRYALNGWQWWPEVLVKKVLGASAGIGLTGGSYTIDTEYPSKVAIPSTGVNVRMEATVTSAKFGHTTASGLVREADGMVLIGPNVAMPLIGWVEGGRWAVGAQTGTTWAKFLLDGKPRFAAKALVRVA